MLVKYKFKFFHEKVIYIMIAFTFMNLFFISNNAVNGFYLNKDLSNIYL